MKTHLQEFDLLRVIATLAVIAIHISAAYVLAPFPFFLNQLVRFAVPLFIIMSGFLLYYTDLSSGSLTVIGFYRKRGSKILAPYLIWTIIYTGLNYLASGDHGFLGLFSLASNLLWGTAYYHLYFIVIIAQLYLLYPLLQQHFKQRGPMLLITSFFLTLICQTALYLNMIHLFPLPAAYQNLYLVAFPVWVFYFVLGMYIAENTNFIKKITGQLPLGLIWVFSLILLIIDGRVTSSFATSMRPSVIIYTVSSFFFFYKLAIKFSHLGKKPVAWLAKQSFLIYLMHPFFLTLLNYAANWSGRPKLWAGTPGMLAIYLATASLTIGTAFFVSFTPLAAWLGGERPSANRTD